jgi:hypothetical protein
MLAKWRRASTGGKEIRGWESEAASDSRTYELTDSAEGSNTLDEERHGEKESLMSRLII